MSINNVSAVSDAIKYLNGVEISPKKNSIVKDAASSVFNPIQGGFAAWQVGGALKSNTGVAKLKELPAAIKNLKSIEKGSTIRDALRSTSLKDQFVHTFNNTVKSAEKKVAEKTTEKAASKGIFSAIKGGISKLGKGAGKLLSKIPGANKVSSAFTKFGGTKVGKFLKGGGAVFTAIMDGAIELGTNVIPAFKKGGFGAGMKQIAKSGAKVAASACGWAGGTCAATAIGAAIGSVFPGVGTIIGGAVGTAIGGILGSSICGGIMNKIVGKSEVEKIEEKETEAQAQQIASDSASMQELNSLVAQKVQEDIQSGNTNEDTEKMLAILQSGALGGTNFNYIM